MSCNRPIEYPNTRKSTGNGFPMKKYVGAMVWMSYQLVIAAEIDNFENKNNFTKKTHVFLSDWRIKKNKTTPCIELRIHRSKTIALRLLQIRGSRCVRPFFVEGSCPHFFLSFQLSIFAKLRRFKNCDSSIEARFIS